MRPERDTEYLTIRGRRLEVAWYGPGPDEAPTLIFLHEGLGCVDMWRDFPAKLADITGCGSLVYSRLGYGQSEPCDLPRRSTPPWDSFPWGWFKSNLSEIAAVRLFIDKIVKSGAGQTGDSPDEP